MFMHAQMTTWFWSLLIGARCAGCGARGRATPCSACWGSIASIPGAPAAAFLDGGVIGRLVRVAKRGDWRAAGPVLGALLAGRLDDAAGVDAVTWIPAAPARRARRGGHLPERLARAVADRLGVQAIATLERTGCMRPQRGLDRATRLVNVRDAFRIRTGARVAGMRLLLIDDVRTTGATLRSAALLLERHGALVTPRALVGVPDSRPSRLAGVEKRARSVENPLTKLDVYADGFRHHPRKAAASVRTPRPP